MRVALLELRHIMSDFYKATDLSNKGAWVVHHGQKTSSAMRGAAEFPALDAAGKAASLMSQLAATDDITIDSARVKALAIAAGLNPKIELPSLLDLLSNRRVIDTSTSGDVTCLGVTSHATVRYAAQIFEDQQPTPEEQASVALSEITSKTPTPQALTTEFIADEFKFSRTQVSDFLQRSEAIGFVDTEGSGTDKLYFNGNLFRRDSLQKTKRVLESLNTAEQSRVATFDAEFNAHGFASIATAERLLGTSLFDKLKAAALYDVHYVANPSGEFGFVTQPSAFHKFNDPLADDAFDLAKALVAALAYGMTQSGSGRGKIEMIEALLRKLINGGTVGPATAIGEDYRVLETKGVLKVTKAASYGWTMRLLKKDVGEMALNVLTTGDTSSVNALDRPLPGSMTGYSGPEKARSDFRKRQIPTSRKMTHDVLEALRTKGGI